MIMRTPSTPGHPVATCDRDHGIYVTVGWTQPEIDGGANVTGYAIKYGKEEEFSLDVDQYDEVSVDGNTTNFQFTHQLKEWTSYRFAVAAVNAVGRGEFSEFTESVHTGEGEYCRNHHRHHVISVQCCSVIMHVQLMNQRVSHMA